MNLFFNRCFTLSLTRAEINRTDQENDVEVHEELGNGIRSIERDCSEINRDGKA